MRRNKKVMGMLKRKEAKTQSQIDKKESDQCSDVSNGRG